MAPGTLVPSDPEPDEVIFFHGHPSWLSLAALLIKGLLLCVAAGVVAGIVSAITDGNVQIAWVIVVVVVVFIVLIAVAWVRRIQTTYSITSRRLTIETGILSRELHQTRLERVQNVNATPVVRRTAGADRDRRLRHRRRVRVRLRVSRRPRAARDRADGRPGAARAGGGPSPQASAGV